MIVVWVDCWTSLGGSQFLDSPGTGNYLTYLCDEIVPFVDERYRTIADRDHRGIQGKSSGGYGAMVVPMLRPDLWGDSPPRRRCALRGVLPPGFPRVRSRAPRSVRRILRRLLEGLPEPAGVLEGRRRTPAERLCMAACYSADPDGTVRLPFDTATGELIPEMLGAMARPRPGADGAGAETLRSMRAITSMPAGRTSTSSTSAPRRSDGPWRRSASPTCRSSSSTRPTWRSNTGIRSASDTSRNASPPDAQRTGNIP